MPLIGSGIIKITKTETMEDTIKKLLSLTNSSPIQIEHRLEELKSIESKDRNLTDLYEDKVDEIINDSEYDRMINNIKNQYIIKNLMFTIANIADYKSKVCCLIYLMKKKYNIMYSSTFILPEIETEYAYVIRDNEKLNEKIKSIYSLIVSNSEKLEKVKDEFRKTAEDEIVEFMLEKHEEKDLVKLQTGNFYRDLRRNCKEKFTKEQEVLVAAFLKKYKATLKSLSSKKIDYCKIFEITADDYESLKTSALKPIIAMSAFDLLAN